MRKRLVPPLFLFGMGVHDPTVLAQTPGIFTPTGDMTTARCGHNATLLFSGKVLVTGGGTASAELYDPVTGTFTATGVMGMPRADTATLLPDGRVLFAGGPDRDGTGAEVYDPSTGTFTAVGRMTTPRFHSTATLLNNGKVLITGGYQSGNPSLPPAYASAELYDPSAGTFSRTGDMTTYRSDHKAVLLHDGKVLIDGSYYAPGYRSAELYDPETGTFTLVESRSHHESSATATLLTNGKVLFAGGFREDFSGSFASAEVYERSSGIFSASENMTTSRSGQTSSLLPDGMVLIAGGQRNVFDPGSALASVEVYNPSTSTFSAIGDMTASRFGHTTTLLPDGAVLIAGGCNVSRTVSAEIYRPALLVPAPILFSLPGDERGQGAILHAGTARAVSARDPAVAGEALEIYSTGLLEASVIPPQVAIGDRMAEVLWFGKAPGYSNLNQVNVRVPSGIAPGPTVPVRLTYLGRHSNEVSIGVQ